MGPAILALSQRLGRNVRLWGLRTSRALALAPTTVGTALSAIAVLLVHRLEAGRGDGSVLAARPVEERRPARPAPARQPRPAVRPAA